MTRPSLGVGAACAFTVFVTASPAAFGDEPRLIGLGSLPGGQFASSAFAISADGTTVVGSSQTDARGGIRAFRWTQETGIVNLGELHSAFAGQLRAQAVSGDGSVVAGFSVDTRVWTWEGFRWSQGAGMTSLGHFPGAQNAYNMPYGMSGDGSVIVGTVETPSTREPYRWTQETGVVPLGRIPDAPSSQGVAHGISGDGSIIVGEATSPNTIYDEAFRWTQETGMIGLGDLPGGVYASRALATSADGNVIVGASWTARGEEAFRWTPELGMVALDELPYYGFSEATAVSADGSVIVGRSGGVFIWDEANGMRYLHDVLVDLGVDMTGWSLLFANGISADGTRIVGTARNPQGNNEAFMAIIPAPGAAWMLVLAAGLGATRRRRTEAVR